MTQPCTLIRRSASASTDDYGDEIRAETLVQTYCELQQRASDETSDEVAGTSWIAFFPATLTIDQDDAIVVDGDKYELTGEPWKVRNPRTKQVSHIEVSLRRVAGVDSAS